MVSHRWRIVPGPSMSHKCTVSPGLKSCQAAPFSPDAQHAGRLAALARAPVGFSNESDRETRPVSSKYG